MRNYGFNKIQGCISVSYVKLRLGWSKVSRVAQAPSSSLLCHSQEALLAVIQDDSHQNSRQQDGRRVGGKKAKGLHHLSVKLSWKLPRDISIIPLLARTGSIILSSHKDHRRMDFFPDGCVPRKHSGVQGGKGRMNIGWGSN